MFYVRQSARYTDTYDPIAWDKIFHYKIDCYRNEFHYYYKIGSQGRNESLKGHQFRLLRPTKCSSLPKC